MLEGQMWSECLCSDNAVLSFRELLVKTVALVALVMLVLKAKLVLL